MPGRTQKLAPGLTKRARGLRIDTVLPESGPVAQLGARFHGMEEVIGSLPIRSTNVLNNLTSRNRRSGNKRGIGKEQFAYADACPAAGNCSPIPSARVFCSFSSSSVNASANCMTPAKRSGAGTVFRGMEHGSFISKRVMLTHCALSRRNGPRCGICRPELFPKTRGSIFRKSLREMRHMTRFYIFPSHPIFAFGERLVFQLTPYFNLPTVATRTAKVGPLGCQPLSG